MTARRRRLCISAIALAAIVCVALLLWRQWHVRWVYRAEVRRCATQGPDAYLSDNTRYAGFRKVVEHGEPAVRTLLPYLRSEDENERLVAAAMLGTVLRQAYSTEPGTMTDEVAPVSEEVRDRIELGLIDCASRSAPDSRLEKLIKADLAHVKR